MHKQKWTKVNAPVDEGIKDLVDALSAFPKLQTIESCIGNKNNPAWVSFWYGNYWKNSWKEFSEFVVGYLGEELVTALGDKINISVQFNSAGLPQGELSVRPGAITDTIQVLRKLAT